MREKGMRFLLTCLTSIMIFLPACENQEITMESDSTSSFEKPQYGGTLEALYGESIGVFDPVAQGAYMGPVGAMIFEQFLAADWAKGLAGTGEVTWGSNTEPVPDTSAGVLVESWEIPESGTFVFKVRRGIHWALNPDSEASRLVNGREVTADDLIASFNYLMNHERSPVKMWNPHLAATTTIEKTGPWEVTLKSPADPLGGWHWFVCGGFWLYVFPPEVIEKYGDMTDWRNLVGTGPFMLTKYINESSATLERNPDYWGKDPTGPGKGNQLPYLDEVKLLVITDLSSIYAAFRTGKSHITVAEPGIGKTMIQDIPELKYQTFLSGSPAVIMMRGDKADLPYKDKRVRQALMMAIDYPAWKEYIYEGEAEILAFPVTSENKQVYVPLEEMSEDVQALFSHNTDKARQLLAEAGYPEGFDMKMIVVSTLGVPDTASALKDMWADIGVNMEIQVLEPGAYISVVISRSYEDTVLMYLPGGAVAYPSCLGLWHFSSVNWGYVNDPVINAVTQEIKKHTIINMPEADRLFRELVPYIVEQVHYIPLPSPYWYKLWWPWVKNYHGENFYSLMYTWVDQDLHKQIMNSR
ncbi:MAG TPA: ABC transporter substrate-binding protein [Dehalococcoidia bacterium]|nr:ABC transporter substrate-binding protein [Dehalococcoidia bacterium]